MQNRKALTKEENVNVIRGKTYRAARKSIISKKKRKVNTKTKMPRKNINFRKLSTKILRHI